MAAASGAVGAPLTLPTTAGDDGRHFEPIVDATPAEARTSFNASVWGDFFINYDPPLQMSEGNMRERANQLKEEVCGLLEPCSDSNALQQMSLVETLQHLSIDHLFKEQIDATLRSIHSSGFSCSDLHEAALRFRLLRSHGLWVSTDELVSKFRGDDGSFSAEITKDPRGLLSLYNAAHLSIHGEVELDEAILFARHHLESLLRSSLKSPLADQVARALKLPLPRRLKRLEALRYMSEYMDEQAYNPSILELAKLDFNLIQLLHLKELKALSQWWKDLYQEVQLNLTRDRVVEIYFWAHAVYYEQENSRARMMLSKTFALVTMMDDIYDVYAADLDECRKLAEALRRWDASAVSVLPEYMRKFYLRLLRSFEEMEDELQPEERYRAAYNREAFQLSSEAYLQEAEFYHHNCNPTFEEQVEVALRTIGGKLTGTASLMGMGAEAATREAFEWSLKGESAIKSLALVARFMNDIASFSSGKNEKDGATSLQCYMNEYKVSSEVAIAKLGCLIEDAWKTANQALFDHTEILPAVQRVNNFTICMPFTYGDKKDAFTSGTDMKDTVERLFVNPLHL